MGAIEDAADEGRRRALEIGAEQGAEGVRRFQEASARINQEQSDALARAAADARQINAPQGLGFEGLIARPTTQMQQVLATQQAGFQSAIDAQTKGATTYFDKLHSLGPLVDAQLAAAEAAKGGGGGGSGGGGSGGGGGGKGETLSDSELRVRLKGAATAQRDETAAAAVAGFQEGVAARKKTSKQRGKVKAQIQKVVKGKPLARGVKQQQLLARAPAKAAHGTGIPRAIDRLEARKQQLVQGGRAATPHIDVRLNRLNAARNLLLQRRSLATKAQKQDVILRQAYTPTRQAITAPLAPIARQIALDAGLSPDEAYGLISPTEEKSLNAADLANFNAQGGALGVLGRPPRLAPKQAAKQLKMPPAKAAVVRKSPNYATLAADAESALSEGQTLDDFAKAHEIWSKPYVEEVRVKQSEKHPTGIKKVRHPGHANLLNLVMFDYAPAFER